MLHFIKSKRNQTQKNLNAPVNSYHILTIIFINYQIFFFYLKRILLKRAERYILPVYLNIKYY